MSRYQPSVADFYQSHTTKVHTQSRCGNNSAVGFYGLSFAEAARIVAKNPKLACQRCGVTEKLAQMAQVQP